MIIFINNTEHNVPSDLSQVTLGRFIQYYQEYGKDLDEQLNEITEELDYDLHIDKEALSWYSFFTGYNFFESKDIDLTDMLLQYRVLRSLLKESENACKEFPVQIEWNKEQWQIQDFKITPGSTMSFGEIITGKEVVRQINKMGQGKWDALPYLCAVYLRKKGEKFTDELVEQRVTLMNELPLNYALMVAFFLSSSISIFRNTLLSSINQAATAKI
jgi:hypothetical protein